MTDQHRALMPAQFNLNDDVKVKLTDHGRDLLAKKRRLTRQPDEAGYAKFQLWELMNIFGEHFYNGCSIPFEFNRILLAPFNPAMNDQLRTRVEALEAWNETQRQATLAWGKDLDNHGRWIDDHLKRIMALEAGQKPSLSTSLHSYSVGEAKPPEDCGKVKVLSGLSQHIIGSLEWTQQAEEQELDSVLLADKKIGAVPAHRGGQSIRFEVSADDPELSDYGSGKLLALSKVVYKVLSNNMLESGIIEVTAISVGLVTDMLDQQAEYAAQQMDQAAPSPSPAPTDSLESTEHAPADSLVERPKAFQTLCAYARNYIKEYGDRSEAYELECIIDLLSRNFDIPSPPPEGLPRVEDKTAPMKWIQAAAFHPLHPRQSLGTKP